MKLYTCTDCHTTIPTGLAVIRSQSFQRVTYCKPCAQDRGLIAAEPAPLAVAV